MPKLQSAGLEMHYEVDDFTAPWVQPENKHINYADIRADLPKIRCPTLVIVTEESGLGSVERTRAWQQAIPDSELLVMPGNSYHVAATHPEACAAATMDFIERTRARANADGTARAAA